MEIRVFKDVSAREKTSGGLTGSQWLLIISLIVFIAVDIVNSIFAFVPDMLIKPLGLILIGLGAGNALYRPHGLKFGTWLRLYWKYHTTIQTRTYGKEEIKKYDKKDFFKDKKINEAECS